MDKKVKESIDNLASTDDKSRFAALQTILELTADKVDWVYEVWDSLVYKLDDENSYQRSIAILVLCNLAKSDDQLWVAAKEMAKTEKEEKYRKKYEAVLQGR